MADTIHTTAGGKELLFFDIGKVQLMRAANRHPKLVQDINNLGSKPDWPDVLAEIAAYVLVSLEGMYMPSELDKLADHLYWKLQDKLKLIGSGYDK